mmetsp:Transcript_14568/g.36609  ORF Transcript_14568/g.36609 Transcript_14568/m.36609 type:complete len:1331 (+) Transcript_14568:89-4081(+)
MIHSFIRHVHRGDHSSKAERVLLQEVVTKSFHLYTVVANHLQDAMSAAYERPRSRSRARSMGSDKKPDLTAGMSGDQPNAIWTARHVEMPIPSSISLSNYQKLYKASRETGAQLGIVEETNNAAQSSSAITANSGGDSENKDAGSGGPGGTAGSSAGAAESSYFSGFMSRVLNPTNANESNSNKDEDDPILSTSGSSVRPLRPPRTGCVATANSWMVAALECPGETGSSTLRLITKWNVRRMSGGAQDQWMALPPPVGGGDGRIMHVFVDPTGTHTLLSARNGEAYYHHSSQREFVKLSGFGKNADGSWPSKEKLNGISASSQQQVNHGSGSSAKGKKFSLPIQQGLTTGSYVTAVAWDREKGTEGTSRKFLLGTSAGEIYEYMLVSPSEMAAAGSTPANAKSSSSVKDDPEEVSLLTKNPILLHQLRSDAPVTGLSFERLRTGLLVLCCTSGKKKRTRFYTFYSAHNSSFRMAMADESHASLVELPGSLDRAELKVCNDQICMRTETGIYYGTIDRAQSGSAFAGGSMIVDPGILPYDGEKHTTGNIPDSLAVTPQHIITLENNEVRFINRVAQKTIQTEKVEFVSMSSERALDESVMGTAELMCDIRRPDQVWLRKARSLVHISSSQEDRDVWKYTLQKCLNMQISRRANAAATSSRNVLSEDEKEQELLFEQAKSLCTNPSQKAVVTAVRAEYHLSQGRAELAAKYLSQCPPVLEPFADTAVRLALTNLGIDDPYSYGSSSLAREALKSNLPLITYLSDKMRVGKNSNDKMTCTMIGAWLTELYLHERDTSPGAKQSLTHFLSQNVHTMDAKTIMKILTSHDVSATDCAAYAAVSGDIATAVNAALRVSPDTQDGVGEALRILNEAPFEIAESLYYKHSSTLLARAPTLAGKSFLSRYTHGLSPTRLLPSFMHYERLRAEKKRGKQVAEAARGKNPFSSSNGKTVESVDTKGSRDFFGGGVEVQIFSQSGSFVDEPVTTKYLEGVIKLGCQSSAIYSFLISLYVDMADEEPLFKFLSQYVPSAASERARRGALIDEGFSGPLDMSYALRTILGTGRHFRSAIKLYMGFGMRQQAVELALRVDPSLARELAQDSVELEERRRLWLMIAKNAASQGVSGGDIDVVSKVVSVLRDCGPDVLSIEDVLPFLPDFAQIDQIKDEICEALTSYSSKIEGFLKEMNDCDHACDALRGEISRLRTHRMDLKSDAKCAFTKKAILTAGEPFYVFPSGYVVLESALKQEIKPHLNVKQRSRVEEIEQELVRNKKLGEPSSETVDSLQSELDGLIAAECPLTGSAMVDSIDQLFADSVEIEDMLDFGSQNGARNTASV